MTTTPNPAEFTVSAYDLEDQKERHRVTEREYQRSVALATQKNERRKLRITALMYVLITAIVAAACIVLFHEWWLAVRGPSAKDTLNQEIQLACVDKGGTWTTIGNGKDGDKTCVFLKETTP